MIFVVCEFVCMSVFVCVSECLCVFMCLSVFCLFVFVCAEVKSTDYRTIIANGD